MRRRPSPNDLGDLAFRFFISAGVLTAILLIAGPVLGDDPPPGAWAWGGGGCLGEGTELSHRVPVRVLSASGAGYLEQVSCVGGGAYHSLAVLSDGGVWAWGENTFGELGDGTTTDRLRPVRVVGPGGTGYLTGVVQVAGGLEYSLALRDDGTVWAWGDNWCGQLGDGTTVTRTTPVQVKGPGGTGSLDGIVAVAAHADGQHSLALRDDGTVWAWGYNSGGQLGDGTHVNRWTPVHVLDVGSEGVLGSATAIAVGGDHSMAVLDDGTVCSWGRNTYGQLGDGTTTDHSAPVRVAGAGGVGVLSGVQTVACGYAHSLGVKSDGTVWAWGWNACGQLGDGTMSDRSVPVQVVGKNGVGTLGCAEGVAAGGLHSLALASNGTVCAWGDNSSGQLGDGSQERRYWPVSVAGPGADGVLGGATGVAAGESHSLIVGLAGSIGVSAATDYEWMYENAPLSTQGRHKCVLTLTIDYDLSCNTSYEVGLVMNPASVGDVAFESTGDRLTWHVKGGAVGGSAGLASLYAVVHGVEQGGSGSAHAVVTVRRLGDITSDGSVGLLDKLELNKSLNGLPTAYDTRDFDQNGDGSVGLMDKLILNKILNGVPVQ